MDAEYLEAHNGIVKSPVGPSIEKPLPPVPEADLPQVLILMPISSDDHLNTPALTADDGFNSPRDLHFPDLPDPPSAECVYGEPLVETFDYDALCDEARKSAAMGAVWWASPSPETYLDRPSSLPSPDQSYRGSHSPGYRGRNAFSLVYPRLSTLPTRRTSCPEFGSASGYGFAQSFPFLLEASQLSQRDPFEYDLSFQGDEHDPNIVFQNFRRVFNAIFKGVPTPNPPIMEWPPHIFDVPNVSPEEHRAAAYLKLTKGEVYVPSSPSSAGSVYSVAWNEVPGKVTATVGICRPKVVRVYCDFPRRV